MNFLGYSFHKGYFPDGTTEQMTPFDKRASHAGISRWEHNGKIWEGFNKFSIGLEIYIEGAYNWQTFKDRIKLRESFTDKMYNSLAKDCAMLCKRYGLNPKERIVLHNWISGKHVRDKNWKIDPGSGFDWYRLVSMVEAEMLRIE
jgi:N-acetyl-anhydromuramyl-L-alanine amidase AmpD